MINFIKHNLVIYLTHRKKLIKFGELEELIKKQMDKNKGTEKNFQPELSIGIIGQ